MRNWKWMLPALAVALLFAPAAMAADGDPNSYKGLIGLGAGLAMGFAVLGGGLGQGLAAKSALEGISRNPQASNKITVPMFASLAFVESLVILTFIVAYFLQGYLA